MNRQESNEVYEHIDTTIDIYGDRTQDKYNFSTSNINYDDALEIYCGIKIKYNDSLEFISESPKSNEYSNLISKYLIQRDDILLENIDDLITEMACDWYRDEFTALMSERCDYMYQKDMLDYGLEGQIDSDSGETVWIGRAC